MMNELKIAIQNFQTNSHPGGGGGGEINLPLKMFKCSQDF